MIESGSDNHHSLLDLPNVGPIIAARLATIGIMSRDDLSRKGATVAYRELCVATGIRLPVCYNLYSLEAALRNIDWHQLTDADKAALKAAI